MNASLPFYLYKILSKQNWESSKTSNFLLLPPEDQEFIHFSTEEQLERIISKYWKDVPEYLILKVDPNKLIGQLILEANPGGSSKYYHLYNGSIPKSAIIETVHYK